MKIIEITDDTQHPIMLAEGDQVRTVCGRVTTPFPRVLGGSERGVNRSLRAVGEWLIDNAREAVRARGDQFNLAWLDGLEKPAPSDKDSAYDLLFHVAPAQSAGPLFFDTPGVGQLHVDNPGGQWLAEEQALNQAKRSRGRGPVARGLGGAQTAWLREIALPIALFDGVPGVNSEHRERGERQFEALLETVRREGWQPSPVLVGVTPEGSGLVIEGNTSLAVARHLGVAHVPVELRYVAGGEQVLGTWAPARLQALGITPAESVREAARVGLATVEELQAKLAAIEAEYEPLRRSKAYTEEQWDAVGRRAAEVRGQLQRRTGDWYGRPKTKKPAAPDSERMEATYDTPDAVPREVMAWLRQTNQILTSDATDAVRWARIVDTLGDERYPAGDLTIYRAVAGDEIRPGDWVTTDRGYAEDHVRRHLGRGASVLEMTVDGRDVLASPTGNAEEALYAPRHLSGPHTPAGSHDVDEVVHRRSDIAKRSGMSAEEVNIELELFLAEYVGAASLCFVVRDDAPETPGGPARQAGAQVSGVYRPRMGMVTLVSSEFETAEDVRATLLHEVVAHYGLRAVRPQDRTRILTALWESREHAGLRPYFDDVRRNYPELSAPDRSLDAAEEVFARLAETAPDSGVLKTLWDRILVLVVKALRRSGFQCVPMTPAETRVIVREIADGIRRERVAAVTGQPDETWHSRRMAAHMKRLAKAQEASPTPGAETDCYSTSGFLQYASGGAVKRAEAAERAQLLEAAGLCSTDWNKRFGWQSGHGYLVMRDGEPLCVRTMSFANRLPVVLPPGLDVEARDRMCEHLGATLLSACWYRFSDLVTLEGIAKLGATVAFAGAPGVTASELWDLVERPVAKPAPSAPGM